jgi:DNA repair protein RadD
MQKARVYQEELHQAVRRAIAAGKRSILVCLPTGGGKTFVGTRFMHGAELKGNESIFLVPRRELAYQAAKRLQGCGIEPGIIMSGEPLHSSRLCQVASFDTIHARVMKKQTMKLPNAKLVIPDEAHLSIAETRQDIINAFGSDAITIGLTATAARADGKPLGAVFDHLIIGWSVAKMVQEGYLVGTRYFAPSEPDLKALKVSKISGDYTDGSSEKEMIKPKIIGDVIENWLRLAGGQSTVVFCVTRKHMRYVTDAFVRAGVAAECVDGETPEDERKAIFDRVESGKTTVLVNVFVASYGLDIPRLTVCQLARPTKSLVLYFQMIGRTLRPIYAPWADEAMLEESAEMRLAAIQDSHKPYSMVIDHAGAVKRHGFVDEPVPWTLEGDESISDVRERERQERKEPKEIICPRCKRTFKGSRFCPSCGFELVPVGEPLPYHAADLEEISRDGKRANQKTPWSDKIAFMGEAKQYAAVKGYNNGYAANIYKEKFGVFPNDARVRNAAPRPPTALLIGFIKHKAMKKRFKR